MFPPEVRGPGSTAAPVAAVSDDNEERSKVREMIRQQMERGELSTEPENELGKLRQVNKPLASSQRGAVTSDQARTHTDEAEIADDDFFGEEEEEEDSQQSEASGS